MLGKLRRERGLSQAQLAEKVGVTTRAVCKWETRGVANARYSVMAKVANVLGVTMEELADEEVS